MATGGFCDDSTYAEFEDIVGSIDTGELDECLFDPSLPPSYCAETKLDKLESLINTYKGTPDNLLAAVLQRNSVLLQSLEDKILPPAEIVKVLNILSIVCQSSHVHLLQHLFSEVETTFIDTIDSFLNMLSMRMQSHMSFWNVSDNLSNCCLWSIDVITFILSSGTGAFDKYKRVLDTLKAIQHEFQISPHSHLARRLRDINDDFKEKLTKYRNQIKKKEFPPNDFRTVEVLPSVDELHGKQKPFLRKNITNGSYGDLETYLDIHFRLLREDFVRQMKDGITKYRLQVRTLQKRERIRDIHLFRNVQIGGKRFTSSGVVHLFQFQIKTGKKFKSSKRLLTGNLVCLSSDDFEHIIFGTITNSEQVEEGIVGLQIPEDQALRIQANERFVIAEAATLFLPYKCVLTCIKAITDYLPFQKYIVHASTNVEHPAYLSTAENSSFDFASLLSVSEECSQNSNVDPDKYRYSVLDTETWPDIEYTDLDETQYDAIKTALTQELAIIQGPPGTGKTYIGLKIARIMSENVCKLEHFGPILIVCYTNHALDQFLEGVLKFCGSDILRIGGRCKNPELTKYEYKSMTQGAFAISKDVADRKKAFDSTVLNCSHLQKLNKKLLKESREKVLPLELLSGVMSTEEMNFFDNHRNGQDCPLQAWLGLDTSLLSLSQFPTFRDKRCGRVFFTWYQNIVDLKVQQKPFDTRNIDLGKLKPCDRVRLFKHWIHEVSTDIEKHIDVLLTEQPMGFIEQINDLEKVLIELNTRIVSATRILSVVTKNETFFEIFRLRLPYLSIDEALQNWLYLDVNETSIELAEKELCHTSNWIRITSEHSPLLYVWYSEINERKKQTAFRFLHEQYTRRGRNASYCSSLATMTYFERFGLYMTWINMLRQQCEDKLKSTEAEFLKFADMKEQVETVVMADTLRRAHFIGMTTTKAAMHREALEMVSPKVVIIEEAAEVLEAHVVSSLSSKCQHLILIGDHKQLRPKTTMIELSKKYQLDMSLFERLVNNKFPCVTLSEQHRMRPEISKLMRHPDLYPNLKDHVNVTRYKNVLGLAKNVVFLNHNQEEDINEDLMSYTNEHEADFILPFVVYLKQQGYSEDNITIIAPYVGQVLKLQSLFRSKMLNVKITAIDNYQGEENEIVILSLVRSKKESRKSSIGFVEIENRICVSLSRAKVGLFVIGNFDHLRRHSKMWEYMVHQIECDGSLLSALPLQCQNHPETITNVMSSQDFKLVPNGGCDVVCGEVLSCSHSCKMTCHLIDSKDAAYKCNRKHLDYECKEQVEITFHLCGHNDVFPCFKIKRARCLKICNKLLDCGHRCPKYCNECNMLCHSKYCMVTVNKDLPCGHLRQVTCNVDVFDVKCDELVSKDLPCGHQVQAKCSTDCKSIKCSQIVTKLLPCGHDFQLPCSVNAIEAKCPKLVPKILPCGHELSIECGVDITAIQCKEIVKRILPCSHDIQARCFEKGVIDCKRRCEKALLCGHRCTGTCKACFQGRVHRECNGPCSKRLDCGHICGKPCSIICPPCLMKCSKRCPHSSCELLCLQPCNECNKLCRNYCVHKKCKALCQELCVDNSCSKRCNKQLKCTHQCVSVCGETCVCLQCSDFNKKGHADYNASKRYLQLPDCKCIIDLQMLDKHMRLGNNENTFHKTCPNIDCGKVISTDIKRYSNILKSCKQRLDTKHEKDLIGKLDQTTRQKVTDLKKKLSKAASDRLLGECRDIKSQFDVDVFKLKVKLLSKIFPKGKVFHFRENTPQIVFSLPQLEEFVLQKRRKLTHQFLQDFETEVFRTNSFIQLSGFQNRVYVPQEVSEDILVALNVLSHTLHLTNDDKKSIKSMLSDTKRRIGIVLNSPKCEICEMLKESESPRIQNETVDTDKQVCDNNLPNMDIGTSRIWAGDIVENTVIQTKYNFEIMFQELNPLSSKATSVNVTSQNVSAKPPSSVLTFLSPSDVFPDVTKRKDVGTFERKCFISQIPFVERCTGQKMTEMCSNKNEHERTCLRPSAVRNRQRYNINIRNIYNPSPKGNWPKN